MPGSKAAAKKDTEMDDINRVLGKLEASLDGVHNLIREQSDESRESRRKIAARLEEVVLNAQATNLRVAGLEERLARVEPAISEINRWKERAIGARMTIAIFWVAIGGAVTSGLTWAWAHLPGRHP
jgi:predicted  nucleic acid-binding Zn-ribbon protein